MPKPRRVRTRIFVGCEGESEVAFRAWLQDLCDERELGLHLDGARMKGGDPLALVTSAVRRRSESQTKAGIGHRHSLLLIDTDRLDDGTERSQEAVKRAALAGLTLIRQAPCFEAVMLRLHSGHQKDVPRTAHDAEDRLERCWPGYDKPMTRHQLASRFAFADLQRLAQVDEDMRRLLEILGLPQLR